MIEKAQNHKTLMLSWHFRLLTSVEWLIIYAFCFVFSHFHLLVTEKIPEQQGWV